MDFLRKCFIFLILFSSWLAQAQASGVDSDDQQKRDMIFRSHIEFEAQTRRDKDSNQIDGHESEIEFKFYAMKTKNFGFLASSKVSNTVREADDHAQDVSEYAIGVRDNISWFEQPIKVELCYFWLREPAELIQLNFKHKSKLSSSAMVKSRFQFNQTIKSLDDEFERHSFKLELTPVYQFGAWGLGPQAKISQKGWLTRDEYVFSINPFVRYEMQNLEVMLRQEFKVFNSVQRESKYSSIESSTTSLQIEIDIN